jgi:hypothetical protein
MDEFAQSIYLREVIGQAKLALYAAAQVSATLTALNSNAKIPQERLVGETFRGLHSFLTHASNVSRLLWPTDPRKCKGETTDDYNTRRSDVEARGRLLRGMLCIPDSGHPLEDRPLRDHLEHFDERLDEWQSRVGRKGFMDWHIGPTNIVSGMPVKDQLRAFNPATATFTFRDEAFNLQLLVDALDQLVPIAEAEAENARRRHLAAG